MPGPFEKDKGDRPDSWDGKRQPAPGELSADTPLAQPPPFLPGASTELEKLIRADPTSFLRKGAPEGDLLALLPERERREFIALCGEHQICLGDIAQDLLPRQGIPSRLFLLFEKISERCTDLWLDATKGQDNQAALLREGFLLNTGACLTMSPISKKLLSSVSPEEAASILSAHGSSHPFGWTGPQNLLLKKIAELGCESVLRDAVELSFTGNYPPDLQLLTREWNRVEEILSAQAAGAIAALITEKAPHTWFCLPNECLERYPERIIAGFGAAQTPGFDYRDAVSCAARAFREELLLTPDADKIRTAFKKLAQENNQLLMNQRDECETVLGSKTYLSLVREALSRGPADEFIVFSAELCRDSDKAQPLLGNLVARAFLETPRLVVEVVEAGGDPSKVPGYSSTSDVVSQVLDYPHPICLYSLVLNESFVPHALRDKELREKLVSRLVTCGDPGPTSFLLSYVSRLQEQGVDIPAATLSDLKTQIHFMLTGNPVLARSFLANETVSSLLSDSQGGFSLTPDRAGATARLEKPGEAAISSEGWSRAMIVSFAANRSELPDDTIKQEGERIENLAAPFSWSRGTSMVAALSFSPEMELESLNSIARLPIAQVLLPPGIREDLRRSAGQDWTTLSNITRRSLVACCLFEDLTPTVQREILALDPEEARERLTLLEFAVGRQFERLDSPSLDSLSSNLRNYVVDELLRPALSDNVSREYLLKRFDDRELMRVTELSLALRQHSPEWANYFEQGVVRAEREGSPRGNCAAMVAPSIPLEATVSFVPNPATREVLISELLRELRARTSDVSMSSVLGESSLVPATAAPSQQGTISEAPDDIWRAILRGELDVTKGIVHSNNRPLTFKDAAALVSSSRLGEQKEIRDALEQIGDLLEGTSVSIPVRVVALKEPIDIAGMNPERFDVGVNSTCAYPPFARSLAILANGDAALPVVVQTRTGTPLRCDVLLAAEHADGESCLVLERMPNRQMEIGLADVVLEWARSASRSTSRPLVVTPEFLEDVGGERAKILFSKNRTATRPGEISSALPDSSRGFFLSNALLTDIEGFYG